MARTRSIRIRESLEELEQLRKFHKGTPRERRILFLSFLKESSGRTIAEASIKAGISERRGRRWWDAYRKSGLTELLDLRIWKKEELDEENSFDPHFSGVSSPTKSSNLHTTGIDFPAFLAVIAGLAVITEPGKWTRALGDALMQFLPDVDYAVVNIQANADWDRPGKRMVFHQNLMPSGEVLDQVQSMREKSTKYIYESLLDQGKRAGFPFDRYHFPPQGFDFFVKSSAGEGANVHVGSILLFRRINEPQVDQHLTDLVERLRPFLVFLFTDFIVRTRSEKPGADLFSAAVSQVAGDVGLSPREQDVLLLEMLGHSYDEIAELLHVSPKTIQTHVRALYQKAGVSRLSEFFARYFTPRSMFPEKKTG